MKASDTQFHDTHMQFVFVLFAINSAFLFSKNGVKVG